MILSLLHGSKNGNSRFIRYKLSISGLIFPNKTGIPVLFFSSTQDTDLAVID